jgi:hypothetical protein
MAATIYKLGINAISSDDSITAFNEEFTQGNPVTPKDLKGNILVKDIKFNAQMYSPNSLEVVLSATEIQLERYDDIRLSLYKSKTTYVAQNYYVVEKKFKITSSGANQREYILKAYSADYFLTIDKFCQAFTGKTLKDGIVVPTLQNSVSKNFKLFRTLAGSTTSENLVENLQNFVNTSIIPYAVQYNESFYEFLVRMCNRDGEFLYFGADNKLHIGLGVQERSLGNSYTAEFIQTYNTDDTTNWVEPDYLGKLKDKECNYLEEFNAPITDKNSDSNSNSNSNSTNNQNNQSNIYSYCGVLAPEYLENISEPNAEREDYVKKDEYYTDFSLAASVLRSFFDKKTLLDALVSTSKSVADQFIHIDKWVGDYKKDFNDRYSGYLYADNNRTTASYVELYKNLEEVKSYQVKVLGEGEDFPELGSIVVFNNDKYVVYKLDVNFISKKDKYTKSEEKSDSQDSADSQDSVTQQEDSYRQVYKLLLVKGINQTDNSSTSNKFYPLPMPEKRIRKASAQRAIVMDNFDPDRIGRVRVKFPWQKDTKVGDKTITDDNWTPWIRISTPMASKDAGMLFIPTVGDEVLVDFENENVEFPYVSGAFYSDSHRPSVLAQSQTNGKVKSITSTNGHHIAFFDNGSAERYAANFLPIMKTISSYGVFDNKTYKEDEDKYFAGGFEISDYHGIYSIKGSTHNRSIDISSPFGNVSIDAFQGITINAPLGDVKIVGKNVSIEARNNLTLESGTNIQGYFANKNNCIKLPEKVFSAINETVGLDLSFFRTYLEVILRPIGGTMLLKSNRYMRLEAGDGETSTYDAEKKITKNNILTSLVNIESPSPLQDAKKDAVAAYDGLINYKNKLESIVTHYNEYIQQEDVVNFFENDNSVKVLGDVKIIITNGGRRVSKYLLTLTDFDYRSNIESTRKDLEECYNMGIELKNFKNETFKRIVNEFWDNIRRCLNRQATPNFDVPFTKRELVYENLKRIVESNKDLNNSITIGNYHTGSLSDIVTVRTDVIDDTSNPIYKEMGINALGALKGITGLNGILDDKIWSSKDKGTILLSSDKKSFFKMKNDGTFEKGWKLDYKNEFVDIMDSINEN